MDLGDGCFNCGNIQDHTKKAPVALKESVLNGKTKLCLRKADGCSKASPTDAEKKEGARHKEAFEKKNASSSKAKTSVAAISSCTPSTSHTGPALETVHTAQQMNKVFFAALASQQGDRVVVDMNSESSHYGDLPSTEQQALKRDVDHHKSLCIQLTGMIMDVSIAMGEKEVTSTGLTALLDTGNHDTWTMSKKCAEDKFGRNWKDHASVDADRGTGYSPWGGDVALPNLFFDMKYAALIGKVQFKGEARVYVSEQDFNYDIVAPVEFVMHQDVLLACWSRASSYSRPELLPAPEDNAVRAPFAEDEPKFSELPFHIGESISNPLLAHVSLSDILDEQIASMQQTTTFHSTNDLFLQPRPVHAPSDVFTSVSAVQTPAISEFGTTTAHVYEFSDAQPKYKELVKRYSDPDNGIFSATLREEPAKLPAYRVELKDDAVLQGHSHRPHSAADKAVIEEVFGELIEKGILVKIYDAQFSSPIHVERQPNRALDQ